MDLRAYNREKWDKQVEYGNPWTIPVSQEVIAAARKGEWAVLLTEQKSAPREWFPQDLHGVDILCLASGGGQQGPVLAAAGANVTVFDNSPRQLEQDRMVAHRDGLVLVTVEGDMRDLSVFSDCSFDLILIRFRTSFAQKCARCGKKRSVCCDREAFCWQALITHACLCSISS